jgi:Amt family ammonium transporter
MASQICIASTGQSSPEPITGGYRASCLIEGGPMSHVLSLRMERWSFLLAITASLLFTGTAWSQDDPAASGDTPAVAASDAAPTEAEKLAEEAPAADAAPAEGAAENPKTVKEDPGFTTGQITYAVNNIMLFFAAVFVLFMQAGFAMLEAGFNEAKNVVNILCKNLVDLAVGALLFFIVGFGIMYPGAYNDDDFSFKYFAFGGTGIYEASSEFDAGGLDPQVDWFFQAVFAATAATIVSGAVAGRMKFHAYLIYSAVLTGLIYPISGSWKWGGGWLDQMGFHDFAGSVVVHAVGGFAGLAGAIVLGSRMGRFSNDGKSKPILGHNMAFATLGVFILWVGWYGFNPGSQLAFVGATEVDGGFSLGGNTDATMLIAVNTTLSAAAGAVIALFTAWIMFGKPDLSMGLNGALAGLVGITANCDCVTNMSSLAIGAIAGVLVVLAILLLEKLKIDDPVGAWPVHGVCGVWGCIAAGIFGGKDLVTQLTGTVAICVWAFVTMFILFSVLKAIGMLRVSAEDEQSGLDISEHGMHAYGKPGA